MSSKTNKNSTSANRVYSAVMDITRQQRKPEIKPVPVRKDPDPPPLLLAHSQICEETQATSEVMVAPDIMEEIQATPEGPTVPEIKEEHAPIIKSKDPVPPVAIMGWCVPIFLLAAFIFMASSQFSRSWVSAIVAKSNALIVHGSLFILNVLQGACTAEGYILNSNYFKISLKGDLVPLYSLELLVAFGLLLACFQRIPWLKRGLVFLSLVSLAIIANILRVIVAFGLALNYGATYAEQCFHGALVACVFIVIISGLIFFEYLYSSD